MVPLSIAVPAAVATGAYLNARHRLVSDASLLLNAVSTRLRVRRLEKNGRFNLFYVLQDYALNPKSADRSMLVFEGQEWTYRQAYELSLKWGSYLKQKYSIGPGEMIALDSMNHPVFIWALYGLWSIGASVALINYNLTKKPLTHSVKISTARLLLVDVALKDCFPPEVMDEFASSDFRIPSTEDTSGRKDKGGPLTVAFLDEAMQQEIALSEAVIEPDSVREEHNPHKTALLIYTSGTTGLPKPAVITWGRIQRIQNFIKKLLELKTTDRFYTCMPLYHSAGAILGLFTTLDAGSTFVFGNKFSTKTFWSEVCNSKATVIQYVGETCRYLLSAPESSLDRAHNVRLAFGNGLRPDIWNKFKQRFAIDTIIEFYGATEGAGSTWNVSRNEFSMGAIGRSGSLISFLSKSKAAIVEVDPATEAPARDPRTGFCIAILPSNPRKNEKARPGEAIYRLFDDPVERLEQYAGYWGNKKASDSKVLSDVFEKGDLWYRSGDLLSNDTEGRTYFHDRIGDTFRWRSENVSTNEVAEAISTHPGIAEANVYGVEVPRHDGRAGCATVILASSSSSSSSSSAQLDRDLGKSLASHAFKNLPKYAVPIFIRVTSTIERTGTNKQVKSGLREQGIQLDKVNKTGDVLYWLDPSNHAAGYVEFHEKDLEAIRAGRVRL